jgi:hypothetical protein
MSPDHGFQRGRGATNFDPFGAIPALVGESKDPFGAKRGNELSGA